MKIFLKWIERIFAILFSILCLFSFVCIWASWHANIIEKEIWERAQSTWEKSDNIEFAKYDTLEYIKTKSEYLSAINEGVLLEDENSEEGYLVRDKDYKFGYRYEYDKDDIISIMIANYPKIYSDDKLKTLLSAQNYAEDVYKNSCDWVDSKRSYYRSLTKKGTFFRFMLDIIGRGTDTFYHLQY